MFQNQILVAAMTAWLVAQVIKTFIDLLINKRLNWRRIFGMGGMPSSHTAFLVCLTMMIAFREGIDSTIFALSLALTVVVVYDAMGVRYQTGKQGKAINSIYHAMLVEGKPLTNETLLELIGHTPTEVFFGALIGLIVPLFFR